MSSASDLVVASWQQALACAVDAHTLTRLVPPPPPHDLEVASWQQALSRAVGAHTLTRIAPPVPRWVPGVKRRADAQADAPDAKRVACAVAWANPFVSAQPAAPAPPATEQSAAHATCTNFVPGRGLCNEPLPPIESLRAASASVLCMACGRALVRTAMVEQMSGSDTRGRTAIAGAGIFKVFDARLHGDPIEAERWFVASTATPSPVPLSAQLCAWFDAARVAVAEVAPTEAAMPTRALARPVLETRAKRVAARGHEPARAKIRAAIAVFVAELRDVAVHSGYAGARLHRLEDAVAVKALEFADLLSVDRINGENHVTGLVLFAMLACGVPCIYRLLPPARRERYVSSIRVVRARIANEDMRSKLFLPNVLLARNLLHLLVHHGANDADVPPLDADGDLMARAACVPLDGSWTLWRLCEAWLRALHISGLFDRNSSGEVNQDVHSNPLRLARMQLLVPDTLRRQRRSVQHIKYQVSTATEAVALVLCVVQCMYLPFTARDDSDADDASTASSVTADSAESSPQNGASSSTSTVGDETDDDDTPVAFGGAAPPSTPRGVVGAQGGLRGAQPPAVPLLPLLPLFRLLDVTPSSVHARLDCFFRPCAVQHDERLVDDTVLSLEARMRHLELPPTARRFGERSRLYAYLQHIAGALKRTRTESVNARVWQRKNARKHAQPERISEQQHAARMLRRVCKAPGGMAALPPGVATSATAVIRHLQKTHVLAPPLPLAMPLSDGED